jgi:hypothetical protein
MGSLATLAVGGLILFGTLLRPPPAGSVVLPISLAAVGIVMAVVLTSFSALGIWTAIGIFRRRAWARISIVVFALGLTFIGAGALLATLFTPLPATPGVSQKIMDAARWGIAGFYGLLAAIGVWWLVLFNLKSTKEYFAQNEPSEPGARPLSVSVIAWFLLSGTLFFIPAALLRIPAFAFGSVFTGRGGMAVYTLFAGAQIYLGVGLLQLKERARLLAIGYYCAIALNGVLTMTPRGMAANMKILEREMPAFFPAGIPEQMPPRNWAFLPMGIAIAALPIWFLVRRRAAFAKPS